jgi:hypothetical protein
MTDQAPSLTRDQVLALRFAAHRQLTRWANTPGLSSHQHAQRSALIHAARVLQDQAFAGGCELRAASTTENGDD